MDELWMYGGAFLIGCLGIGLFRLAAQETGMPFQWKICFAMIFCNLASALVLRLGYGGATLPVLKYLLLAMTLGICAWTDYRKFLILNRILLLALVARAVLLGEEFLFYGMVNWKFLVISAAIAAGMFMIAGLLCKAVMPQGVGAGDIKLLFVLGCYTGADLGIQIISCTMLILFTVSVLLLVFKKVTRKSTIPFAPFLYAGMLTATLLFGI